MQNAFPLPRHCLLPENRIKLQERTGEEMELILSYLLIKTVRGTHFPKHPYDKCVKEHFKFLKSYRL